MTDIKYPEYDHSLKMLQRCITFLKRWNGGIAEMYELRVGHRALFIRVTHKDKVDWLNISCSDPEWIQGPRIWENCKIEIKAKVPMKNGEIGFILFDNKVGFEIHTAMIESSEHSPKKHERKMF